MARSSLMKQPLFQRPPGTTPAAPARAPHTAIPSAATIAPPSLDNYEIGDRVIVESMALTGYLRFVGPTEFKSGTWAGIELDTPTGKNDGSVGGVEYFRCRPKCGIFVLAAKIVKSELLFPSDLTAARTLPAQETAHTQEAPPAPQPGPISHAAEAASKITAGSRASKYIGMTATQLKQRNVVPAPATTRLSGQQPSGPSAGALRASSPTIRSLSGLSGSPTGTRTIAPGTTNGRANSPSPVPKPTNLRASSPTTRSTLGARLSQTATKPTLASLASKTGAHSRSTSSTSSVTSQSSASGARARTSPTPRTMTTPRRLSSRSDTPDVNSILSLSESRSNLLDQASAIQMAGSPQENASLQLQQLQHDFNQAMAENNSLKSEVSETKIQLETAKLLEKKELSYEERVFLSKTLGREAVDERLAQELEELHALKSVWDKEKAAKDQEIKVVTDKMTQAWLDAARSQKERAALVQEKTALAERLRILQETGVVADGGSEHRSDNQEQQALVASLQQSLQEADERSKALEIKIQELVARAGEEEDRLSKVIEESQAAMDAKSQEWESERQRLQTALAEREFAAESAAEEMDSKLKAALEEAAIANEKLKDSQTQLDAETQTRQQELLDIETKLKMAEGELQETLALLAKNEKITRGLEDKTKDFEAIVSKREQEIANLKLELQEFAGMVQSEEVDRMRKMFEHDKLRLEEAISDNLTLIATQQGQLQALESTEEELQDKVKALEASQSALLELKTAAEAEVERLQKSSQEAAEAFGNERAALEAKVAESETTMESRLSENKERLEQLEEIALSVEEWKERCEAMQFEMIQKTAMVEDLGFKLQEAQVQQETLQTENTTMKKALEEQQAQTAAADKTAELESSRAEVAALEEEREQLLVKVSELESALALSASTPRATSSAPADSEAVLNRTELEEEIAGLKQMVHELTAENASVASDNKKLMQEHDILMEAHKHVETECLKLMDEVERLHSESLAVSSLGDSDVADKDELEAIQRGVPKVHMIGQDELKAALSNVTAITKDAAILAPSEKQAGQNQSASVIRLENLLKDKQSMLDRLTQAHALEMRDLRQRYVELDRSKSWELTQLNKELTELESLIESKIFHEADLEEEVQKKQKQIDRLQHEVSELKSQLTKLSNGAGGSSSDLPPNGLGSFTSSNGVGRTPAASTEKADQSLFCEVCEVKGHDLISCVAVFGGNKPKAGGASVAPVHSSMDHDDDDERPYCENCEEFGLHYTDECPNESLTLAAVTMQVSLHDWILIGTMIFGGCCSNVFALEILVNDAPKSGQMITFAQFLCVSLYGLAMHLQWPAVQEWWAPRRSQSQDPSSATLSAKTKDNKGTATAVASGIWRYIPHLKPRKIPVMRWMAIVIMFFSVSVLNNLSLAYKISVPLHIIFRSGGLMVGMLLGMLLMKKRYTRPQMFAVLIVTLGVIYATTSAKTNTPPKKASHQDVSAGDYAVGVFMLTVALVISSLMGLLQESTYQTYGAEWREGLFYSHFLALPMFLLFWSDIAEQVKVFNQSTPIPVLQLVRQVGPYLPSSVAYSLGSFTVPRLWIFLAVNTLTQFMCISGVHRLTSLSSALTLNFILNLRKFTSLLISVLYFENGFGFEMAVGSSLVLLGTIMYSVSSSSSSSSTPTIKKQATPSSNDAGEGAGAR
ncbi:golgi uridine diphosphate-N- acetylglucosamine transporter [Mortierella alpina]|nr:golgi uridine diphosphate-N- acetylglucosamine transporter [Mortierella alpina]